MFETLKESYNDKYTYLLPDLLFDKNLMQSQNLGILDLQSNLRVDNFETNKTQKTLINNFDWTSKNFNFKNGLNNKLLGRIKNVNYETKNIDGFKQDGAKEIHGVIGFLSELEIKINSLANLPKRIFSF